jgi:hypothetical protein
MTEGRNGEYGLGAGVHSGHGCCHVVNNKFVSIMHIIVEEVKVKVVMIAVVVIVGSSGSSSDKTVVVDSSSSSSSSSNNSLISTNEHFCIN